MSDVLFRSAGEAAALVAAGEVSAVELTEAVLARIDAVDPALNAVVARRRGAAMREAEAADRAAHPVGPLHGVPITVKESFHVAGMPTTWGNPDFVGLPVDADATVVARLRAAGAIVVGTTNVAYLLGDFGQSDNEVYGATVNPWDPARAPGGSSGGSAAAVAAGLSFLEFGSDLAGSIRIPAAFCGVYGLKPTAGTVPLTGFAPPGPTRPDSELNYPSAAGPLARSAADLRTALRVTGGPDGPAALAYSWAPAPSRHRALDDFRVGVVLDHPACPVSSELADSLSNTVDALAAAGARVVPGWPPGLDPRHSHAAFGGHVEAFLAIQTGGRLGDLAEHETTRLAVRAAWQRYFADVDVFLCPTAFVPAIPHDRRPMAERTVTTPEGERSYFDLTFWTAHASLAGLPSVVAPVGRTAGGLPVGLQVVGPSHEDDTAITFAELLAEVAGGYEPPPVTG